LLFIKDETSVHIVKAVRERIIKNFLDIIILVELKTEPLSGYDIITLVNDKFHFLVSAGTVYTLLYSLERKGLVKGNTNRRKTVYTLTEKGVLMIETILNEPYIKEYIIAFLKY
jgi:DNA-binding PadR family transcriptional regulator